MSTFKKLVALLLLVLFSTSAFAAITDAEVFAYAVAKYPFLFSGTATVGQYQTYDYRYYPLSRNYLAVDTSGTIYILGAVSGGQTIAVGTLASFTSAITAWKTAQCTLPQVYTNGVCVTPPPTLSAGYVAQGGLMWTPMSSTPYTYAQATELCAGTINAQNGWRLPTLAELSGLTTLPTAHTYATGGLYGSGAMNQQWTSYDTWSSTPSGVDSHYGVYFDYGNVDWNLDANTDYVTCVRKSTDF
jgi:hypothetical protein